MLKFLYNIVKYVLKHRGSLVQLDSRLSVT